MRHKESTFKLVKPLNLLTEYYCWPESLYSRYNIQKVFNLISICPSSNVLVSLIWNDFRLIFNLISYLSLLSSYNHSSRSQDFIKNYIQINVSIVFSLLPSNILSYHPVFLLQCEIWREHPSLVLMTGDWGRKLLHS